MGKIIKTFITKHMGEYMITKDSGFARIISAEEAEEFINSDDFIKQPTVIPGFEAWIQEYE